MLAISSASVVNLNFDLGCDLFTYTNIFMLSLWVFDTHLLFWHMVQICSRHHSKVHASFYQFLFHPTLKHGIPKPSLNFCPYLTLSLSGAERFIHDIPSSSFIYLIFTRRVIGVIIYLSLLNHGWIWSYIFSGKRYGQAITTSCFHKRYFEKHLYLFSTWLWYNDWERL